MGRVLIALAALGTGVAVWLSTAHPYGLRFAMGIWPVPEGTPWTYQFESGFVPALTVLTLLTSVLSLYHIHNCHMDGCWRVGKHRVHGTPWCNRHMGKARPERSESEILLSIEKLLDELVNGPEGL
jgi:hypothetical protein